MAHTEKLKASAREMRAYGVPIPKIAKILGISKSTAFKWTKDVVMTDVLRAKLINNSVQGREKGRQIRLANLAAKRKSFEIDAQNLVIEEFSKMSSARWALIAAILFWCEGGKRGLTSLGFTNSDPKLMLCFLTALRNGFEIDESKFGGLVHLHEYHDAHQQMDFWSKQTGIPKSQFSKPYLKPNTGKRKREGYPGCLALRYYDATLAQRLDALYHAIANNVGV